MWPPCQSYDNKLKRLEEQLEEQNKKLDYFLDLVAHKQTQTLATQSSATTPNNKETEDNNKEIIPKENIKEKLDDQIINIRKKYKEEYYKQHLSKVQNASQTHLDQQISTLEKTNHKALTPIDNKTNLEKIKKIKKKSILIVGDSLLNGIEESKLSKSRHIRVQPISGAKIEDVKSNLEDLIHEDLQKVIIHVGTNNAVNDTANEIFEKLKSLKEESEGQLPKCDVIISSLIKRTDDVKAHRTNEEVNKLIKASSIEFIDNSNIKEKQLGKRGLHLNNRGNSSMASNLLNAVRK